MIGFLLENISLVLLITDNHQSIFMITDVYHRRRRRSSKDTGGCRTSLFASGLNPLQLSSNFNLIDAISISMLASEIITLTISHLFNRHQSIISLMTSSYRLYWHNIIKVITSFRPDTSSTVINIFVITACHSLYSMLSSAIITLTSRGKMLKNKTIKDGDISPRPMGHNCPYGPMVRFDQRD